MTAVRLRDMMAELSFTGSFGPDETSMGNGRYSLELLELLLRTASYVAESAPMLSRQCDAGGAQPSRGRLA